MQRTVWFGPRLNIRPFRSFFSTAFAFGTAELDAASLRMRVIEGELPIEKLVLTGGTGEKTLDWRVTIRPGTTAVKPLNVEDPSGHAM